MPRYALKIEYDGRSFSGWQAQAEHPSVQARIEAALAQLDPGFAAGARIAAAGRTDAGVHATGQLAHADLTRIWDPFKLAQALNWHLKPAPIAITAAAEVPEDFHARFSAIGRRYLFRLIARRAPVVHERGLVWQVQNPLNVEAMRQGAAHLIGTHDFTTFRSTMCQAASPVKSIDCIEITEIALASGTEYQFRLAARSFLHNQVRSIVGTLERVGAGSWQPDQVKTALEARDRAACGPVCPPQGLYLTEAVYPTNPFAAGEGRAVWSD
ncbi:tRNA pseudouridine(38-40) synthase TruA [Paracoccus aminophilus]|uniref:tRNA pseudouridine synthase A n=1 Tax=Paracoccus aminophilus JCM 7686 TaxID=1367847 RepID=S5XQP6_PARAH|nr:tRNA pseudouridine(38-40) synthase TruA [Paracoccus aminophilus]AGT09714.1 tRNA pseudouridine synthase A [Paracoccus aminophilus JCM 7686]